MLLLEVVSAHKGSMGANVRRYIAETEAAEFTIGRLESCNWVLPQDYVSRVQAVIRCVNGMYFLESKGNAPLAINDRSRPIERNRIVRLSPGDRILIDDIDILVSEVEPGAQPHTAAESSGPDALLGLGGESLDVGPTSGLGDVMELIGGGESAASAREAERRREQALFPEHHSALDNLMDFRPPAAAPQTGASPGEDPWWEEGAASKPAPPAPASRAPPPQAPPGPRPARPTPRPAERTEALRPAPVEPARPAPAPASGEVTLDDVLRGAGLDPAHASLSPEVAQQLGELLRIVVAGTMEVLKARNDIRRELRLPSTVLASSDNNPLKFSADVDDALHKLLVQRSGAYLGTVAAFREAFGDIRHHQVALLKSVGVAFDYMLGRFDPEALEGQFGSKAGRAGVLGLGGKARPWQAYVEHYAALLGDRDHAYRKLFGEEWAKAYEKELQLQKSRDRAPKEPS